MLKFFKNKAALTGLFVVGAVILLVFLMLALAGGSFFKRNVEFTSRFDKTVKGLNKGAPVMFRGVQIGQVTDINVKIRASIDDPLHYLPPQIEVVYELDRETMRTRVGKDFKFQKTGFFHNLVERSQEVLKTKKNIERTFRMMVERHGLRVKLQMLSLLTGQLYVEMDFVPNASPLTPEQELLLKKNILPIQLSMLDSVQDTMSKMMRPEKLDAICRGVDDMIRFMGDGRIGKTLSDVETMMQNANEVTVEVKDSLASVKQILEEVRQLTASGDLTNTLHNVQEISESGKRLLQGPELKAILENATVLSGELRTMAGDLRQNVGQMATDAHNVLQPGAEVMADFHRTLVELERAAMSLQNLADMLERNPESLLRGR